MPKEYAIITTDRIQKYDYYLLRQFYGGKQMMNRVWKQVLSLACAATCCLTGMIFPGKAQEQPMEKWVIYDGGTSGATVSKNTGEYIEWSRRDFGLKLPKTLSIDKLGLYIRVTLDEAAAEAMNKGGSIELAQATCDKSELSCSTTVVHWKAGLNEVIVPIGGEGGYTDGGQARFNMYETINCFRFYTTPVTAAVTKNSKITVWEISVVDSTVVGIEFGTDDVYMQLSEPLDGTPNTIEVSIKPEKMSNTWSLGATGAARTDGSYAMTAKSGTTTQADTERYGVPAGLTWKGGTVPVGGYFGLAGKKFTEVIIPSVYTVDNLALSFWLYTSTGAFPGVSSIELTSSGTCDVEERGWTSDRLSVFKQLQVGWNHIVLPLASGDITGGDLNLSAINYTRIWGLTASQIETELYVTEMEIIPMESAGTSQDNSAPMYHIFSNAGVDNRNTVALWLTIGGNVAWTWGEKSYVTDVNAYTGQWMDLALVRDMSQGKFLLYADGALVAEKDATGTADIKPTEKHCIAANALGEYRFVGWIGDVRAWSDVRSANEIADGRIPKQGVASNHLDANTQGLLGSWLLIGDTTNILTSQQDTSKYSNAAIPRGSRADQWENYKIPTDVIGEDYYSIVFIPDIQELVTGKFTDEWMAAAQWIADNVETENIIHVIGAGDSTWTADPSQWQTARDGFDLFADKVSWSNMTGNHDYPGSCLPVNDTTHTLRDSTNYQAYFGLDYINQNMGATYFVDYFKDPYGVSTTENSYYRFNINGVQWMILQLEYLPRVHVIEWAGQILEQYPDDNVILTTHSYITGDHATYTTQWMPYSKQDTEIGGYLGELMSTPANWPNGDSSPIWEQLVYPHENVKMLLCGHAVTSDGHVLTRTDKNAAGYAVPQVMINAQDQDVSYFASDAMGMLGILRFSADGTKCEIQYYSPYHESSYHPSNQEMRSLTLAISSETQDEPSDSGKSDLPTTDPSEQLPGDPSGEPTDEKGSNGLLLGVVACCAVVVVAAVAVMAIILKKKKK